MINLFHFYDSIRMANHLCKSHFLLFEYSFASDNFIVISDINFIRMSNFIPFHFLFPAISFSNSHILRIHIFAVPCVVYMLIFLYLTHSKTHLKIKALKQVEIFERVRFAVSDYFHSHIFPLSIIRFDIKCSLS